MFLEGSGYIYTFMYTNLIDCEKCLTLLNNSRDTRCNWLHAIERGAVKGVSFY